MVTFCKVGALVTFVAREAVPVKLPWNEDVIPVTLIWFSRATVAVEEPLNVKS